MKKTNDKTEKMRYNFAFMGLWLYVFLAQAFYEPQCTVNYKQGRYRQIGQVQFLYPLNQDANQLLYSHVIGLLDNQQAHEGNFGLGYRVLRDEVILGGYGFYDMRRTPYQHFIHQMTLGLEYLTATYELRGNVYMPFSAPKAITPPPSISKSSGTREAVGIQNQVRKAVPLSGFDIEWGISALGFAPLQLWVSYYYFYASDIESLQGPRARLAYKLRPWLSIEGEWSHDRPRGWNYFIGTRLSLAFDSPNVFSHHILSHKMTQMPVRDIDVIVRHQWDKGQVEPTFVISTPQALQQIGSGIDGMTLDANYILGSDIDLSELQTKVHKNGIKGFQPIGTYDNPFRGRFSGEGYTLRGLFVESAHEKQTLGLFGVARGHIEKSVLIEKIHLAHVFVKGGNWSRVGSLAGSIAHAVIRDVSSQGRVDGNRYAEVGGLVADAHKSCLYHVHSSSDMHVGKGGEAGGLIGIADFIQLQHAYSHSCIEGGDDVAIGGLVGSVYESSIFDVYSMSKIQVRARNISSVLLEAHQQAGGLIGKMKASCLERAHSTGFIQGGENVWVGGLVGWAREASSLLDVWSSTDIQVGNGACAGGLIGWLGFIFEADYTRLARAYSVGSMQAGDRSWIGGLVGTVDKSHIVDIYSTSHIQAGDYATVGGLVGQIRKAELKNAYFSGTLDVSPSATLGAIWAEKNDNIEFSLVYWNAEKFSKLETACPSALQQGAFCQGKTPSQLTDTNIIPSWFEGDVWLKSSKGPVLLSWLKRQDVLTLLHYFNYLRLWVADLPLELRVLIFFYTLPHGSLSTAQIMRLIQYASAPMTRDGSFLEKSRTLWSKNELLSYVIEGTAPLIRN